LAVVAAAVVDPHTAKLRLQVKTPVEAQARVLRRDLAVVEEQEATPRFFQS
jgi:hypothetical protein